jgi:alkylated DNA repair dioxygenase AlkB
VLDEFHVHLANANALVYGRGVDRRRGPDGPDGSERGAAMKKISACHAVIIGNRSSAAREKWDFKAQAGLSSERTVLDLSGYVYIRRVVDEVHLSLLLDALILVRPSSPNRRKSIPQRKASLNGIVALCRLRLALTKNQSYFSTAMTNLFSPDPQQNLLPYDGEVFDHGVIFSPREADAWMEELRHTVPWQHDEVMMFGKRIVTAREVAWYADAGISYRYSGVVRHPHAWSEPLLALKSIVEKRCGVVFHSCLLNLYHHGEQGMGWHSDDEASIVAQSPIASLSFGAERRFCFKHKREARSCGITLSHGSLLVMRGATQQCWLHRIPPMKAVKTARINLTFRQMVLG